MKLNKKGKYIVVGIIIILTTIGGILWKQTNDKKEALANEKKNQYKVQKGDIKVQVKVSGNAKLANQQKLSFGKEGKITRVNVSIGDEVKKGDVLAHLDMNEYESNLANAELNLQNAELALEKILNNDISYKEIQIQNQIEDGKKDIKIGEAKLGLLKKELHRVMREKENIGKQYAREYKNGLKNLELAKSNLDIGKISKTEETNNSLVMRKQNINNIIASLKVGIGEIEGVVKTVDKIFGVSDDFKDNNNLYEHLISVKDSHLKDITRNDIQKGYQFINILKGEIDGISVQTDNKTLYEFIESVYDRSEFLMNLCDNALNAIDKSIEGTHLSRMTLNNFQSSLSTARGSVISLRTGLEKLSSNLASSLSENTQKNLLTVGLEWQELEYKKLEDEMTNLSAKISTYIDELKNLKISHTNDISVAQANIEKIHKRVGLYEKELQDLRSGPNEYDVSRQKNMVKQAILNKKRIQDGGKEYKIVAEFDGRVRSIDIIEGEQFELDNRKYIIVENPNLIELELELSQIDMVRVKEGNNAIVTFDAYPYTQMLGKIGERNVTPKSNKRGGVYYSASIFLEKQEKEILAGMSAIVSINVASKEDVFIVPTLALVYKGSKVYVSKRIDGGYRLVEVSTGINNNFEVEIIEGLEVGDIIQGSVLDKTVLQDMGIDAKSSDLFSD